MGASDTRTAAAELLIEDFATVLGQTMGWSPTTGRTAGVLLLSGEPMTARQLQAEVGASAGAMSEITRLLITNGVVHRFKQDGARHYVHQWRADAWVGCLEHQLAQVRRLRDLAHRTEASSDGLPALQQERLGQMAAYYDFMVARLTSLLEDYRARL